MKKSLLLGLAIFTAISSWTLKPTVAASKKPYCSVASTTGASWHTWSQSSHQQACYTAFFKVLGFGQSVDKAWKGYYKPGLNKAKILCNQGSKTVYGNDKQVFTNAINMKNQLGWKGCIIQVVSN